MKHTFLFKSLLLTAIILEGTSFIMQNNNAQIKGKLKRLDFYMSRTHQDYTYDIEGRLKLILKPYGEKEVYSYSGNLIFIETTDPRGYTWHDTIIKKAGWLTDSVLVGHGFWLPEYDLDGKVTREVYVPVKGKKRKPGDEKYIHSFTYYCDKGEVEKTSYPCDEYEHHKFLKTHVCINYKGDTIFSFKFKYLFNSEAQLTTEMQYYSNGQLYDSVGYTYY